VIVVYVGFQWKKLSKFGDFIIVYIKTKKVPSRTVFVDYYPPSIVGFVKSSRSTLLFEDRLDKVQESILEEAERLAISTSVPIKVVDLAKPNAVSRLVRRFFRKLPRPSTVVLPGSIFSGILRNQFTNFKHLDESSGKLLEEQVIPEYRKHP